MEPISIRAFAPADLDAVADLWRAARTQAMPALEARVPHTPAEDRAHLAEVVIPTHRVFVAERGGAVVGFASLEGEALGHLYVAPEAQRRGVGEALLAHAKSLSPDRLALFTHRANRRARAFYEARGFRAVRYGTSPAPECEPDVELEWTPAPPRVRDPAVLARRGLLWLALAAWATSFALPSIAADPTPKAGYEVFVLSLATILLGWLRAFPIFLAALATAYLPVHLALALRAPPSRRGLPFLAIAVALGVFAPYAGLGYQEVRVGYAVWLGAFVLALVERLLPRGGRGDERPPPPRAA